MEFKAPIDVHLMVSPVDRMIGDFLEAGADIITFHPEASDHIDRSLQLIKSGGAKAGLVFNPATPLHYLDYVLDKVDQILLMSVNPGLWWPEIYSHDPGKIYVRRVRSLMPQAVIFALRLMVVLARPISVKLPKPVPICLWPVQRFLANWIIKL